MTTTSIDRACPAPDAGTESELRAAARRCGLTMKELAVRMGVSASYLSQIANGRRPWTPKMREKVAAVLGEVPGQGTVYRQGGVVTGESSFIRERARTLGMTMQELADRAGVSYGYMTDVSRGRRHMGVKVQARVESALQAPAKVAPARCANRQGCVVTGESSFIRERARELGLSLRDLADRVGVSYSYMSMVARGHRNMGVKVQARMESALEAPAKVAPAQPACIDREAVWDRMNAHGFSQNEVARHAGISSANLSQIMNGRNNPSPVVLKKLHGVLFQPTKAERVMPAEVKVLGWRKGERSGMLFGCRTTRRQTVKYNGKVYKYDLDPPRRYYRCYGVQKFRLNCRNRSYIRAERLEELVWGQVKRVVQDRDLLIAGIDALDTSEDGEMAKQVARTERDLQNIQLEEDRAIRLYVSGKITESQLDHQRKFITERLENLRAKLDDYRARESAEVERRVLMEYVLEWAEKVGEGLDDLPSEERRDVLQILLDRVMIDRDNNVVITLGIPTDDLVAIGNPEPESPCTSRCGG